MSETKWTPEARARLEYVCGPDCCNMTFEVAGLVLAALTEIDRLETELAGPNEHYEDVIANLRGILTVRTAQLKDARNRAEKAEAERDKIKALLRRTEWDFLDESEERGAECSICDGLMSDGHNPGCELAEALK